MPPLQREQNTYIKEKSAQDIKLRQSFHCKVHLCANSSITVHDQGNLNKIPVSINIHQSVNKLHALNTTSKIQK